MSGEQLRGDRRARRADESRLVMQVAISDDPPAPLFRLSMERAALYARRTGADYRLITEALPGCRAEFSILEAYNFDYDKIFYVDWDAVILDDCPDIFEYDEFAAAADGDVAHLTTYNNAVKEQYGMPLDHVYFNSGVVLFPRAFLEETAQFAHAYLAKHAPAPYQHDQGLLNEVVAKHYGPYRVLSSDWNCWFRPTESRYIQHFCRALRDKFDESALRRQFR